MITKIIIFVVLMIGIYYMMMKAQDEYNDKIYEEENDK
tara:strand:- start:1182 stop:1295 length:114 start_codon:yes stop_codon:yes gene_type:complete